MYDYPQLYADAHAQVVEDLRLYRRFAGTGPLQILELACGTGRVACALARDGHEVTGVDSSAAMLEVARRRAGDTLSFQTVQADIRALELGRRFDLIVLPLNGCAHLHAADDLVSMFACARRHLKGEDTDGAARSGSGLFICHIFPSGSGVAPGDGGLTSRGSFYSSSFDSPVEWYESRSIIASGVAVFEHIRWYFVPDGDRITGPDADRSTGPNADRTTDSNPDRSTDPDAGSTDAPADTLSTELTLRIYSPQDVCEAARAAGLALTAEYGDMDGGPVTSESTDWVGIFAP